MLFRSNFHKSEVIVLKATIEEQLRAATMLNCKVGSFPFTYLGLPISDRKLTIEQWNFLVHKLSDRVEPWIGRFLSGGGGDAD